MQKAKLKLYAPTNAQKLIHESIHRNNVICFGRQSGKSTYGINKMLQKAWTTSGGVFWYLGPTYRLAEQIYERTMQALGLGSKAITDKSDSKLFIELLSGSKIFYKSADNPGALLGETLHGAILDECREMNEKIWTHYVMPMLGTTNGWADFLSTPNGFDWFYDVYQKHLINPDWGAFHAPSTSNPLWTKEMIEEARGSMSEALFAQEILAEFRDLGSGSCYVTFGNHNILDKSPFATHGQIISPHLPIIVGMDFNLSPMSWVLGQHKVRSLYYHDEIILERSHTVEAAEVLCSKVALHKPGVILIGDASGKASQRAAAGESDYSIIKARLKAHGIIYQDKTPDSNPPIKDRINTANSAFKDASGNVNVWFNPRCKVTIKDIQRRRWKENSSSLAFDNSDPMSGHASDAATYPISVLLPIKAIGSSTKMLVISRGI